eukprot:631476-Rhodomonas_salina.1
MPRIRARKGCPKQLLEERTANKLDFNLSFPLYKNLRPHISKSSKRRTDPRHDPMKSKSTR